MSIEIWELVVIEATTPRVFYKKLSHIAIN
jgi:hypothetical protein